jgi:hypothetical protein
VIIGLADAVAAALHGRRSFGRYGLLLERNVHKRKPDHARNGANRCEISGVAWLSRWPPGLDGPRHGSRPIALVEAHDGRAKCRLLGLSGIELAWPAWKVAVVVAARGH